MSGTSLAVLIGIGVFGLFALFIGYLIKYTKKMKARVAEVAMALGAQYEPGDWKTQQTVRGRMSGRDYLLTFHVVSSGQSSVTYLDLKTPVNCDIEKLSIRKATGVGRFFEKLGLNNPLDSGDPYFDEKVAMKGEPEQAVLALSYGAHFKEPAIQLTERKYSIDIKEGELVASKVYSFKKDMNEPTIRTDLTNLVRLTETLEKNR